MALRYGYFDSEITGVDDEGMPVLDRAETSDLFALLFASLVSDGVLASPSNCFRVRAPNDGLKLEIDPGFAMVKGRFCYDGEVGHLEVAAAPQTYSRIDRVVMRCNYPLRMVEITIKTGTEAANPTPPELVRSMPGDYFELCLAEIRLEAGQKMITQSSITDTRPDSSVCGYITQLIDHLDTSVFYEQLVAFYSEFVDRSNGSYEQFREMAADAYGTMMSDMEQAHSSWETAYLDWYGAFTSEKETEVTAWETEMHGEFWAWFDTVKDALDQLDSGDVIPQLTRLLDLAFNVASGAEIDAIIAGQYSDNETVVNVFNEITSEDIDEILGGTYVDDGGDADRNREATDEEIDALVAGAFEHAG